MFSVFTFLNCYVYSLHVNLFRNRGKWTYENKFSGPKMKIKTHHKVTSLICFFCKIMISIKLFPSVAVISMFDVFLTFAVLFVHHSIDTGLWHIFKYFVLRSTFAFSTYPLIFLFTKSCILPSKYYFLLVASRGINSFKKN